MGKTKLWALYVLLFVILSFTLSATLSVDSSASSVYDDTIQKYSDSLDIYDNTKSCPNVNLNDLKWQDYITGAESTDRYYYNGTSKSPTDSAAMIAYNEMLDVYNGVTSGHYMISYETQPNISLPDITKFHIVWYDTTLGSISDANFESFFGAGTGLKLPVGYKRISISYSTSSCYLTVSITDNDTSGFWSAVNAPNVQQFRVVESSSIFPVNYPTGYEGLSAEGIVPVEPDIVRPNITYRVNDKDLLATSNTEHNLQDLGDYHIYWLITYGSIDGDPQLQTWEGHSPPDESLEFTAPEYGTYILQAWYTDTSGASIPDTPERNYEETRLELVIDGNIYSGDTSDMVCAADGLCAVAELDIYEDCSTYGSDIVGGFGCVIKNFGTWWVQTLKWFIVPDSYVVQIQLDRTAEAMTNAMGFMYAPIDWLVQILSLFGSMASNPTGDKCNIGSIAVFGSAPANLELCAWRYQWPQLWSTMQIAIQGSIGLMFGWAYYMKFNAIFGRHIEDDDDSIADISSYRVSDPRTGKSATVSDYRSKGGF